MPLHNIAGTGELIAPSDPLADYRPGARTEQYAIDAIDETSYPYERISDEQAEKDLRDLVEGAYEGDIASDVDETEASLEGLTCKLLPHQQRSLKWMLSREKGKRKGGILADDVRMSSYFRHESSQYYHCRWASVRRSLLSL